MKTLLHNLWLCPVILLLALGGCQTQEDYWEQISPSVEVTNPYAVMFLEQLQKQEPAQEDFAIALSGFQPMYDEVKVLSTSDYGYCYFIPYANNQGVVQGSIYYKIEPEDQEDETVLLNNCPLQTLENVDANHLNNGIGITNRYVYSAAFAELREKGIKVNPELTEFADFLSDGKIIPFSAEESPFVNSPMTKGAGDVLEIKLTYSIDYVGGKTDAVYGMHPDLLKRIIFDTLEDLAIRNLARDAVEHIPMVGMFVRVPLSQIRHSEQTFIDLLINQIRVLCLHADFYISIQYSYRIIEGRDEQVGSDGGGTSIGTGEPDNNPDSPPYYRQAEVINCPHAASTGSVLSDLFTGFNAADSGKIGVNNYISFEEYLNDVAQNGGIEHSTSLIRYEHGDDSVSYHLTPTKHGTANNVGNEVGFNSLVATMHNHPNGTPPSAQDLLFTVEQGMDSQKNYQTTFIYVNDSTYYTLYIKDKSRLADLYKAICDEIDPATNGFTRNGECYRNIRTHKNTYQNLSSEAEQQLYQLAIIIAEYGNGIFITKYNTNSKTNKIYGAREKGVLSNGSLNYQPIICQ